MKNKKVLASLARYFAVMQNDKPAKFLIAKKLASKFSEHDSLEKLWKIHGQVLEEFLSLEEKIDKRLTSLNEMETPPQSFLDLKIRIANSILEECHFCTRQCGVNRKRDMLGYCKCGSQIKVSTLFEHMGEEPELIPSGTIFTLGCTMRCRHCQNWTISQWQEQGEVYNTERIASAIEKLRYNGCRNINLVGGDPTPWLAHWLEAFKQVKMNVPIVWNSNSYYSEETSQLLAGFVDIYLLDFKYGNNRCAELISDSPNYWEASTRNHHYGKKYGELIIRVLVLPQHLKCCSKIIFEWISGSLGPTTRTNVMFQYRPEWRSQEIPELRRRLTRAEREQATRFAQKAGLTNFIT